MIIECIKDVVMTNPEGVVAFVKGNKYRTYRHYLRDNYDIIRTVCAKNDQKERHVINYVHDDKKLNAFFIEHFVVVSTEKG